MSDYDSGRTCFFTAVLQGGHPLFEDGWAVELLMGCIASLMVERPFSLDAMVVLPDHLHCIWTLPEDDYDFSPRWNRLKESLSRDYTVAGRGAVMQPRQRVEACIWGMELRVHAIRDEEDFKRCCDYIHYNPVKHGLASSPSQWKYSSLASFVREGLYPEGWGESVSRDLLDMDLE